MRTELALLPHKKDEFFYSCERLDELMPFPNMNMDIFTTQCLVARGWSVGIRVEYMPLLCYKRGLPVQS